MQNMQGDTEMLCIFIRISVCTSMQIHVHKLPGALLVGQPHPLDVEDDEETLVEGWQVDPQRVPHAFAHGAPVFIHGMLKPQPSSLSNEVVLDSVPV